MAANDDANLGVNVGANIGALTSGLDSAQSRIRSFASSVATHAETVTSPFLKLNAILVTIGTTMAAGYGLSSFVSRTVEINGEVTKLTKTLGINAEAAGLLRTQLAGVGIQTDEYVDLAVKMERQVKQNETSFRAYGIATRDANGAFLDGQVIIQNTVKYLMTLKEGTDRNLASMTFFGRNIEDVTKLLRLNGETAARAKKDMEELGLSVKPEDLARTRDYKIAIGQLNLTLDGIRKSIGEAVLPYLTKFANWFREQGPGIITGMKDTVKTVIDWGFTIAEGLANIIKGVVDSVAGLMAIVILGLNFTGKMSDETAGKWMGNLADATDRMKNFRDNAITILDQVKAAMLKSQAPTAESMQDVAPAPKGTATFDPNKTKLNEAAIEAAKLRAEQTVKIAMEQNQELLSLEKVTNQEFLARKLELQTQLDKIDVDAARKKRDLNAGGTAEWAAANTEMLKISQAAVLQEKQIRTAMLIDLKSKYQELFGNIVSSFDTSIRGLIQGTMTWSQAWRAALSDMFFKFLAFLERKLVAWLSTEAAETTATATGVAARTATESAGTGVSILGAIARAIKSIFTSGAETAAGVTAAVAPVAGPAAPAIGAAAGAETIAMSVAMLPAAEQGAWKIPRTSAWLLHPDEAVLPAPAAEAFRNFAENGGQRGAVHITAWDARSMSQWVRANSDVFFNGARAGQRNNPAAKFA